MQNRTDQPSNMNTNVKEIEMRKLSLGSWRLLLVSANDQLRRSASANAPPERPECARTVLIIRVQPNSSHARPQGREGMVWRTTSHATGGCGQSTPPAATSPKPTATTSTTKGSTGAPGGPGQVWVNTATKVSLSGHEVVRKDQAGRTYV